MVGIEWMFSDAGYIGSGMVRLNRLRWSSCKGISETLVELREHETAPRSRPVELKFRLRDGGMTLYQSFPSVTTTIAELQDLWCEDQNSEEVAIQAFQGHCVRAQVRWMWADVGLNATFAKKNPARWSNRQSVDQASVELWRCLSTESARRPVRLEFCTVTHDGIDTKLVATEANISEALQMLGAFEVQLLGDSDDDHKIVAEVPVASCPPSADASEEPVDDVEESLSEELEEQPQGAVACTAVEDATTPKRKSLSLSEALVEKLEERERRKSSPMLAEDLERRIEELAILSRTTKELHDQNLKRRRKTVPISM
jgi:hypothetical protein